MSNWQKVRLKDVCTTNANTLSVRDNWKHINYLDTGNITNNQIDNIQHLVVGKDEIPSRAKRKIVANDIIFSTVRPNQRHYGIIKDPIDNMVVSTGFTTITSDVRKVNVKFIYYFLNQNEIIEGLQAIAEQSVSTYPSIKPSDIESLDISLPPLAEQDRIAGILGALDDKIECNNRINHNLEEQAAALFRRWFVDFEFPDSDGNPYRSSGGSFVDSDLGKIPDGWDIGKLEEYIEFDPREKIDKSSEYLFFDMKCLSNTDCTIKEGVYRMTTSASSFRNFDTLLAKITPCLENGKTGFVMNLKDNQIARGSTEFIVLRSKGKISPFWIYLLARSSEFRDFAIQSMTGSSGRQRVQYSTIKNIVVSTHTNTMNKFHILIEPLFTQLYKNNKENHILTQLRDSLLPKLLNNEIKI